MFVSAGVKASNAAAGTGTGVWSAYTVAMKAATSAVRGFFSALGVIGAVLGGINMVISLWRQLNDLVGRGAAQAAETAAAKARELEAAEKAAAEAAKERFDAAKSAADEYVRKLREVARQQIELANAENQVRSAKAGLASAETNLAVAKGEMSPADAALKTERITLESQQDNLKTLRDARQNEINEAFKAAKDTAKEEQAASEKLKKAADALAQVEQDIQEMGNMPNFPVGYRYAEQVDWRDRPAATKRKEELEKAKNDAQDEYDKAVQKAAKAQSNFEDVKQETVPALRTLSAQLKTVGMQLDANSAKQTKLNADRADEEKENLQKTEISRRKAQIDLEVAEGEKSQSQGSLEKQRLDLERQRAEANVALEKRLAVDQASGRDTETDDVVLALRNTVAELSTRLDTNAAELEKARSGEAKPAKVEAPMVTAGSDPWRRVGAFVGNGQSSDRQVQIAMRSMTLLERGNVQLGKILRQLERMEATT